MNGLLLRWQKFGRRYFWPHLLLGMVAAGFGIPTLTSGNGSIPSARATSSNHIAATKANFTQLALIQANRHPNFSVDYWHQHAIRTVIRHLSFAMAPQALPAIESGTPLEVPHHLVLLNKLSALLMREATPPVVVRNVPLHPTFDLIPEFSVNTWISQVQGIRAGPPTLS